MSKPMGLSRCGQLTGPWKFFSTPGAHASSLVSAPVAWARPAAAHSCSHTLSTPVDGVSRIAVHGLSTGPARRHAAEVVGRGRAALRWAGAPGEGGTTHRFGHRIGPRRHLSVDGCLLSCTDVVPSVRGR